jgi:hypothetical protein
MSTPRLYVAPDDSVLVVSRQRLRTVGGRTSARRWPGAVETSSAAPDPEPPRSIVGAAVVAVPPVLIFGLLLVAGVDVAVAAMVALTVFFASAYLTPVVRRAVRRRAVDGTGADASAAIRGSSDSARLLFDAEERVTVDDALDLADRISDTWPELGGLVDTADADMMLGSALWDLSGVLVRRQQVGRVLADVDRSRYDVLPAGDAARELQHHRTSAAELLAGLDADIARRMHHLADAERAGRDVIREREARRAVDEAARSLRGLTPDPLLPQSHEDAGRELAERTETVLAAYRELVDDADRPAP